MTAYEILSIVITTIGLLVSVIALFLKLFAFLDSRYKRKKNLTQDWPSRVR